MTGQMTNCGGIPLLMPNDVTYQEKDFYISYNDRDISSYGDITTALVLEKQGSLTKFLILNGNHTKAYKDIIASGGGYPACVEYFKSNLDKQNKFSENWDETTVIDSQGFLYVVKDVIE